MSDDIVSRVMDDDNCNDDDVDEAAVALARRTALLREAADELEAIPFDQRTDLAARIRKEIGNE